MPDTIHDSSSSDGLEPDRHTCETALVQLLTTREGVITAMLAFRDGRPYLVKSRDKSQHPARLAAMVSSLAALSQSILKETTQDGLDLTLLEGNRSKLAMLKISEGNGLLVLAVLADGGVNLGRMLSDTRACAAKVAESFRVRRSVK